MVKIESVALIKTRLVFSGLALERRFDMVP